MTKFRLKYRRSFHKQFLNGTYPRRTAAARCACFRRHLLLAASHNRAAGVKRRVGAERDRESIVLVRALPHHGSTSLDAEQLVILRVGNARLRVDGVP